MNTRGRQQGELEQAILDILWDAREREEQQLTSQQILEKLPKGNRLALTTVLTVLSRLGDKGLVKRENGEGRALLFSSATTREEHAAATILKVFENSHNPGLAFSHFANQLSTADRALLRQIINQPNE